MKKLFLLLLWMPVLAYAETAVIGTQWNQIDSTLYPADDITGIDISGLSNYTGFPAGGGGASSLQGAYDGGDTITTDTNQVTIKEGGSGRILKITDSGDSTIFEVYSSGFDGNRREFIVEDHRPAGTQGGTCNPVNGYESRRLNTILKSASFASLSSITKVSITQPGIYGYEGDAPAYKAGDHQTRLYSFNGATTISYGTSETTDSGDNTQTRSFFRGFVTVSSVPSVFQLQHKCSTLKATNGFGRADFSNTGVFSRFKLWKE